MSFQLSPPPHLPPSMRGTDQGSFTEYSIRFRLPEIALRTLAENSFPSAFVDEIHQLSADIDRGRIRPLRPVDDASDSIWRNSVEQFEGQSWFEVPWFFAEMYFYRRLLEAIRYFEPGKWHQVDPFQHQKRKGLLSGTNAIRPMVHYATGAEADDLASLLLINLWANQADLSLWPVDGEVGLENIDLRLDTARLLVDHRHAVEQLLRKTSPGEAKLVIVADNVGVELTSDLLLADTLLRLELVDQIEFQLKASPVLVSDALIKDVFETIEYLTAFTDQKVEDFGNRLNQWLQSNKLILQNHFFWSSPLAFWEMPSDLAQSLLDTDFVLLKGDANYRRLLGDRHWPFNTPLRDVLGFYPGSLLALRTLKSELIIDLLDERSSFAASKDADWMINGQWGLIQLWDPVQAS